MTNNRSPLEIKPDQEFQDAMRQEIALHWAIVWKAMPDVIEGNDIEAVHKVRVASRRLRAAMDVATDCFPRKWYQPLHKTAKGITRALGEVRDRDVILQALSRQRETSTGDERKAIDFLIEHIEHDRKRARKAMLRFLRQLDKTEIRKQTKHRFPVMEVQP